MAGSSSIITRVYYVPPPGTPPLEYCMTNPRTFQPPDQWWKKVPEEYDVGVKTTRDFAGNRVAVIGPDGKPQALKGLRKKWAPDEEKNKLVKEGKALPPKNYLDCSADELIWLNRQEFAPLAKYLKREDDVKAKQRNDYRELEKAGELELKQLQERIDKARQRLRDEAERAEAEGRGQSEPPRPAKR